MSKFRSIRKRAILFSGAAIIALAGSGLAFQHYTNASAQPAEAPPAVMPAIPVTVRTVNPDDVMIWSEFSGRMAAVDFAEIRPAGQRPHHPGSFRRRPIREGGRGAVRHRPASL